MRSPRACPSCAGRCPKQAGARRAAVLGVCNGFQILRFEAGLLPGAPIAQRIAQGSSAREVESSKWPTPRPPFTNRYAQGEVIRCPVRNHDGNLFSPMAETLARPSKAMGRFVFRYAERHQPERLGSTDIAGIVNDSCNVLGIMPHPENLIEDAAWRRATGAYFFERPCWNDRGFESFRRQSRCASSQCGAGLPVHASCHRLPPRHRPRARHCAAWEPRGDRPGRISVAGLRAAPGLSRLQLRHMNSIPIPGRPRFPDRAGDLNYGGNAHCWSCRPKASREPHHLRPLA